MKLKSQFATSLICLQFFVNEATAAAAAAACEQSSRLRVSSPAAPRSLSIVKSLDDIGILETPPLDVAGLNAEDGVRGAGPARVGIVLPAEISSDRDGTWISTEDGGRLWLLRLRAPEAHWVRVLIEQWRPPDGAELVFFDPVRAEAASGPFGADRATRSGKLWSPIIAGEEVVVEYYLPPEADPTDNLATLHLAQLVHGYRPLAGSTIRGGPLDCQIDAHCTLLLDDARSAVAMYVVCGSAGCFTCTGTHVFNYAPDIAPLFLTARHCLTFDGDPDEAAESLEVIWQWQTLECGAGLPDFSTLPRTAGVTSLFEDVETDVALIGLGGGVPEGVAFLFTNPLYWEAEIGLALYHPRGSFQRIAMGPKSFFDVGSVFSDASGTCESASNSEVSFSGAGRMEPGADGSPILDSDQDIRGVLSCYSTPDCDESQNASYGRMDVTSGLFLPYVAPMDPLYVDSAWTGYERGSEAEPMNSLLNATFAALVGSEVFLKAGNYPETMTIRKPLTISAFSGTATIGR